MKRLLTAAVAAASVWFAACSGGGPTVQPPPPTGKFTLASLKGTYAFTTSGEVFTNGSFNPTSMARAGSFTADGKGGISGGVEDVNASGMVNSAIAINSSGSGYTMSADGRGTLTLSGTSGGVPFTINFGIVLTSGSDGLSPATDGIMIDETSTQNQASTGSGNFILQNTAMFQTTGLTGTYVFDFSGLDAGGFPESIVGEVSSSSGTITGGMEDADDDFALSSGTTGAGSFTPDSSNIASFGRGLATIAGQEYAFYIVDSTRVRLISTTITATTPPMLSGDAVLQKSVPASLSGGFVFLVAGANRSRGGITRVGRFSASGSSVSNTSVLMDTNDSDVFHLTGGPGNSTVSNASISLDSTTGRGTLTFTDSRFNAPSTFVFYLTSASGGVIQETSQVTGLPIVVADGSIAAQSGNPFTSSNITGNYAMNWSGLVTAGGTGITDEEDLAGLVSISNLSLSGTSDIFQFTSTTLTPSTNIGTKGQINLNNGTGAGDDGKRVDMTVNLSNTSQIDMVVYIVSPQSAFFENRISDSGRTVVGILKAQK